MASVGLRNLLAGGATSFCGRGAAVAGGCKCWAEGRAWWALGEPVRKRGCTGKTLGIKMVEVSDEGEGTEACAAGTGSDSKGDRISGGHVLDWF